MCGVQVRVFVVKPQLDVFKPRNLACLFCVGVGGAGTLTQWAVLVLDTCTLLPGEIVPGPLLPLTCAGPSLALHSVLAELKILSSDRSRVGSMPAARGAAAPTSVRVSEIPAGGWH
jgi:hypothetical protein